ncbi:MAG: NUDIX domain-containing protein [Treponema sp.]|nr:NUDIX domain-containing protein [Treponema sp.]
MEKNQFTFCPDCGSKNIQTHGDGRKWSCPDCGFTLYNNVASAVGIILENAEGKILFERRAKEPRKGFLALPGGFAEPDETGEQAAFRECLEEIGVAPEQVRYLCSFPNTYEYKHVLYKTCDMFFTATLPKEFTLRPQQGEVSAFEWVRISSKQDVEQCPLAFVSARNTLLAWLGKKQEDA